MSVGMGAAGGWEVGRGWWHAVAENGVMASSTLNRVTAGASSIGNTTA